MASPIIHLFCGKLFEPSILTLQIMAPIVIFIALSSLYNMQILYSLGKEKLAIFSTSLGAVTNLALCFCLIPTYSQYGAAVAAVVAELVVVISTIIVGSKYIPAKLLSRQNLRYLMATLIMAALLWLMTLLEMKEIYYFIVGTITSIAVYYVYLMIVKDDIVHQITQIILKPFKR